MGNQQGAVASGSGGRNSSSGQNVRGRSQTATVELVNAAAQSERPRRHSLSEGQSSGQRDGYLDSAPPNWSRTRSRTMTEHVFDKIGKKLGGNFANEPEDMVDCPEGASPCCRLSSQTQTVLRERVFNDLDPSELVDYHVHIVGHGDSESGCYIHQNTKTWRKPFHRLKSAVFMAAAQVPDMEGGDVQYMSRLVRLVKHFMPSCVLERSETTYEHGRLCLLPFDAYYEKDGRKNLDKTTLYVPNEYSLSLHQKFPDYFLPVGSVNPYRRDALVELERCASNGVTIIKWLPNSMGINPSDEQCVPFYKKMRELNLILLIHVGEEHSVTAGFIDNTLGNPLLLKKPLNCGVKVIAAHCATEGYAIDHDNIRRPCFDLFMGLMRIKKYKDLLFGDISAVCGFKRIEYLKQLLDATDIHDRLVYGSDYPVPAINLVVQTSKLKSACLINADECVVLNELYNYNPLLFDIASKRLLRSQNNNSFPASVFKEHPLLPPSRVCASTQGASLSDCNGQAGNEDDIVQTKLVERGQVQVAVEVHQEEEEEGDVSVIRDNEQSNVSEENAEQVETSVEQNIEVFDEEATVDSPQIPQDDTT